MTAARFHLSNTQICDNAGNPASGAKINFYVGGTSTPLNTYSNAGLTSANTNPVVADSAGRVGDIFLQDQTYKVVITDSTGGTTFATFDNVYKDVTFVRSSGLPAVAFPNMLVHNTADSKKYRRNSTGTGWIDEGPIDSVGNTAGVSDVLAGTSTSLFATPDAIGALWERGTDIASATTITLPSTGGGYFEVTGTTTITGINSQRSGLTVRLRFNGALTLTNGANFALLGGANITVAAGDIGVFTNVSGVAASGTVWRMTDFWRSDGSPLTITSSSIAGVTATQAQQEGASVTTAFVTPGRLHFHPASPKAWVQFTEITTTAIGGSGVAAYNIASLTDGGVAITTVTFTTGFSSANYATAVHCTDVASSSGWVVAYLNLAADKTASSFKVKTATGNFGSNTIMDIDNTNITFFGDFA